MRFVPGQDMDMDNAAATEADGRAATRSCTTCSKAKAKCVRRPGQEVCERCSRLRKECHSREPVLRRRKVVKTTRAAQLEKLEHKIEHLVNALSNTQVQRGYSIDHGHPSPPISQISERTNGTNGLRSEEVLSAMCDAHGDETTAQDPPISVPTTSPSSTSLYTTSSQVTSPEAYCSDYQALGVTMSEAEILYDRFRRLMAPTFPFVVCQSHWNARVLLNEKPLLLHAIVTVTYFHDLAKQQSMLKSLMRDISERTLIKGERSLDIIQGILVVIAWYHPHVFSQQQTTNLLHLAQAQSIDLGIDRPPFQCESFKQAAIKAGHNPPDKVHQPRVPIKEDFRALAGIYYMATLFATSFKRIEGMRYTRFMEECLNTLEKDREYESDLFLVQMVRLQHLIDETSKTENSSIPMQMCVKVFTVDLEKLRKADPCRDTTNVFLRLQYIAAEIFIWEISLNDLQENNAKLVRSHLEDLCRCAKAVKSFFEVFFTMPPATYGALPFYFFGQFGHCFIALIKLATLEVDGWDMRVLHDELNFSSIIEEVEQRFEDASKYAPDGLAINNDSFNKWATRVRWMKGVYESRFVNQEGDPAADRSEAVKAIWTKPPETPAQQQPTPPDDVLSGDFFNYLDENFWQNFAGDFELGFPEMAMT